MSGMNTETALKYGTSQEIADLKFVGASLLGTSLFVAGSTATFLHIASGDGHFHPVLLGVGLAIGALQGVNDCTTINKGTLYSKGCAELSATGLKIQEPVRALAITRKVRVIRSIQAAVLGLLSGTALTLWANSNDIEAYNIRHISSENRAAIAQSSRMVDEGNGRTRSEYDELTKEENGIREQIGNLRRRLGRLAKRPASDTETLAAIDRLETQRREINDRRTAKGTELNEQARGGRNATIERTAAMAPGSIPRTTGLTGQLTAEIALAKENPATLIVTLLLELFSLLLEVSPILCAAVYLPSRLAARVTLDHFLAVSKISGEGIRQLGAAKIDVPFLLPEATPDHDQPLLKPDEISGEPRRPRGRPRKDAMNGQAKENNHG
jgi:hypothetical protein